MKKELELVQEFHDKFKVLVSEKPSFISPKRYENRYRLMKEEVEEYLVSVKKSDMQNLAKELADILYAVYGTILEHGLQEKIGEVFEEVHKSNMSKDYHELKMVKGKRYFDADISKIL